MMNKQDIERELKTKPVRAIAEENGIPKSTLDRYIRQYGINVNRIKHEYAIEIITWMMSTGPITIKEMANIAGFSERKVNHYKKLIKGN
jgi:AraC-like DNA-binding protein